MRRRRHEVLGILLVLALLAFPALTLSGCLEGSDDSSDSDGDATDGDDPDGDDPDGDDPDGDDPDGDDPDGDDIYEGTDCHKFCVLYAECSDAAEEDEEDIAEACRLTYCEYDLHNPGELAFIACGSEETCTDFLACLQASDDWDGGDWADGDDPDGDEPDYETVPVTPECLAYCSMGAQCAEVEDADFCEDLCAMKDYVDNNGTVLCCAQFDTCDDYYACVYDDGEPCE